MLRRLFLLGLAVLAAAPALAQSRPAASPTRPAYLPTRDVAVTYRVSGRAARDVRQLLVRFAVATQRLRVETEDHGMGFLLVDPHARTARMVVPGVGKYVDLPLARDRGAAMLFSDRLSFSRRGTGQALGLRCTVWDVQSGRDSARACITDDGVILRADGRGGHVAGSVLEAVRVDYATQPARMFELPQGAGALDVQNLLRPLLRPH